MSIPDGDYSRLNLDNVGRIEIVKGAASALYGANAVAGVINIISRENSEPWTANVNTRYNDFNKEWRHGGSFSFNAGKFEVVDVFAADGDKANVLETAAYADCESNH